MNDVYEYEVVYVNHPTAMTMDTSDPARRVNDLARNGWEVVAIVGYRTSDRVWMRRWIGEHS